MNKDWINEKRLNSWIKIKLVNKDWVKWLKIELND